MNRATSSGRAKNRQAVNALATTSVSIEAARDKAYVTQQERESLARQYETDVRASATDRASVARQAFRETYDEVRNSARQRAIALGQRSPKLPGFTTKDVQISVARELRTYGRGAMPKSYHVENDARPLPMRDLRQFTENFAHAQGARAAFASIRGTTFHGLSPEGLARAIDRAVLAETRLSPQTTTTRASRAKTKASA